MVLNYRPRFLKSKKPTLNYQIFHENNMFFEKFQNFILLITLMEENANGMCKIGLLEDDNIVKL
jgi:hypothetical protein